MYCSTRSLVMAGRACACSQARRLRSSKQGSGLVPELFHSWDHCCKRSRSLPAAEKVEKGLSTEASYLRMHL